ncbi:MAG: phosphatase PAP2 family protein [Nitrospinae bacterium]|nr:phosphatase PAP2 family protein [Nitrospinota bacterium]
MQVISIKQNFFAIGAIGIALLLWFKRMRGLALLLATGLAVGFSDYLGAVVKDLVARDRPCHALPNVRDIASCSNSFSFPSNHAINSFTAATLLSLSYKKIAFVLYTIAILIGYSRVYLGVHYPSDVLAGAVCGILIGYLGYKYIYLNALARCSAQGQ